MAHNYLKTQGQKMTFTQFSAECVSMCGSHIKTPKVKPAMNSISSLGAQREHKTYSKKKEDQKDRKIQAQAELIAQQGNRKFKGCTDHWS